MAAFASDMIEFEKNSVFLLLKQNNFTNYWSSFDSNGYDDLNQLQQMKSDELEQVLSKEIGISKSGHLKRLLALFAISSVEKEKGSDGKSKEIESTQILPKSKSTLFY